MSKFYQLERIRCILKIFVDSCKASKIDTMVEARKLRKLQLKSELDLLRLEETLNHGNEVNV